MNIVSKNACRVSKEYCRKKVLANIRQDKQKWIGNDSSNIFPRIWINSESKANLKDTNIDVVRVTKCMCDQKSALISFSDFFRKMKKPNFVYMHVARL